ncbi:MAG: glycosyltransferase family 2 protein [Caulobacterales bacterium]|jgi:glycosyltransferase involved in cell wall biosynthesis|nr:glycosyltransferase family 2 protein [Caulobacterales bacterium]
MIAVSVLIPTFRRPDEFLRAARSVLRQRDVADIEIIAIDNSPEGSAARAFQTFAAESPLPFRFAHEPRPGVAQARNAALALAQGRLIAWLDDDEEAAPTWLAALMRVRRQTGAQSVFGPVRAAAPAGATHAAFYERIYSRTGPQRSGLIDKPHGMGNSLQPRAMFESDAPFDARTDQSGGEDDALFASWAEAGARFAWAHDAIVTEHIDKKRAHVMHGLRRAFAYGQGPCELAWSAQDYLSLARHIGVGAAQAALYGAASALLAPVSRTQALGLLDRAVRGAGKVLWFVEQRFYGEALARQPA